LWRLTEINVEPYSLFMPPIFHSILKNGTMTTLLDKTIELMSNDQIYFLNNFLLQNNMELCLFQKWKMEENLKFLVNSTKIFSLIFETNNEMFGLWKKYLKFLNQLFIWWHDESWEITTWKYYFDYRSSLNAIFIDENILFGKSKFLQV
jgi:hypothetical protein